MTTITSNYTEARFSKRNSALLLIDHPSGIMQLNRDYSSSETARSGGVWLSFSATDVSPIGLTIAK